jgi:hypothetical protein
MSVAIVPGANRIDANALPGELERDGLSQAFHGMLGRHVKARLRQPDMAGDARVFTMAPPPDTGGASGNEHYFVSIGVLHSR